jgi:hypothetical protein
VGSRSQLTVASIVKTWVTEEGFGGGDLGKLSLRLSAHTAGMERGNHASGLERLI